MKLFWKRIFRRLQTTAKFEKQFNAVLLNDDFEPISSQNSSEQMTLEQLEKYVNSAEFIQKKKSYTKTKYKNTNECKLIKQFEKLQNRHDIRLYYQTLQSPLLKEYLDFKENPDTLKLQNLSIVEISEHIENLKNFENSEEYKNYTTLHNSLTIREFEELKRKINEPDFIRSNRFWANSHRWETTAEYRLEKRYNELIGKTSQNKKSKTAHFFTNYEKVQMAFDEPFNWNNLDDSVWSVGFHSNNPQLIGNYSFTNEWQGNNFGQNVRTENGILSLITRCQMVETLAWDVQKAFKKQRFDYTSDVIQNSTVFSQKYGIFSAKIRCTGNIHHAVWLKGAKKLPHINLFYFNGEKITVGNATSHKYIKENIEGISENDFYIYTLEWTPKKLVWYVNNVEVFRVTEQIPHEKMSIGINSFLPKSSAPAEGKLEIDWIKAYKIE